MAIKTILVPLDDLDRTAAALQTALAIAKRFGSHIEILSVTEREESFTPFVSDAVSGRALQATIESFRQQIRAKSKRARTLFESFRARNRLSARTAPVRGKAASASFREEKGDMAEWIRARGRVVDLTVLPRPQADGHDTAAVEAALLETGRPVLMVPGEAKTLGRHVAIGWNGSAEAAGAVAAAMPWLSTATKVTIFSPPETLDLPVPAKDLAAYLAWHGIRARVVTFKPSPFSVGKSLLEQASKAGIDLLVIGGYSHSRQRELIFGGVTRYVLSSARLPVLMLH